MPRIASASISPLRRCQPFKMRGFPHAYPEGYHAHAPRQSSCLCLRRARSPARQTARRVLQRDASARRTWRLRERCAPSRQSQRCVETVFYPSETLPFQLPWKSIAFCWHETRLWRTAQCKHKAIEEKLRSVGRQQPITAASSRAILQVVILRYNLQHDSYYSSTQKFTVYTQTNATRRNAIKRCPSSPPPPPPRPPPHLGSRQAA